MQLRTAKVGGNAGKQFWGCSSYPRCKGTREYSSVIVEIDESSPRKAPLLFPRVPSVRPYYENWQTVFFQACGLPAACVESVSENTFPELTLRGLEQWRIDYPQPRNPILDADLLNILGVIEAILTRGSLTLCSKAFEEKLSGIYQFQEEIEASILLKNLQLVADVPSCSALAPVLDSKEEELAYSWIKKVLNDEKLCWRIIPQVNLASLYSSLTSSTQERGDFLLVNTKVGGLLVEIDGSQHQAHVERDRSRDSSLNMAGIQVIRIVASEVRNGIGPSLDRLRLLLLEGRSAWQPESDLSQAIRWGKFGHQIQLCLLAALRGGWLDISERTTILITIPQVMSSTLLATELCQSAINDFHELVTRVASLYSLPINFQKPTLHCTQDPTLKVDIHIYPACAESKQRSAGEFIISDQWMPFPVEAPLTTTTPARIIGNREDGRWFLQLLFRKDDFREGQWETIERTLKGHDSVVLLPTGGGKSVAFQLSALLLPGRCLIVDPILSLIDDQIDNLKRVGIDRCVGISSQLTSEERQEAQACFERGHYLFCYISPERMQMNDFRLALRSLTTHTPVSLVAIDEAHCVSEWGHDFRTAYLNLGRISREYCASHGSNPPPLVALTGTASKIVLKDVQRELEIYAFDGIITPKTFDRQELKYHIIASRSDEKNTRVVGFIAGLPTRFGVHKTTFFNPAGSKTFAGLVFCPHVNGSFGVVEQASEIQKKFSVPVGVYSGTKPKQYTSCKWDESKRTIARAFKRNQTTILACTKAFGMGIDKPNIRYTVHIGVPASIESFYQEAGRAGRNREKADCAIIISDDDPKRTQKLLSPDTPLEEVSKIVEDTRWEESDDIIRALWFHVRSFKGEVDEVENIATVIRQLGDLQKRRTVNITWDSELWSDHASGQKEAAERALHRLVVIGVVEDYTINYASREFTVRVVGASKDQVVNALEKYATGYQRRLGEEMRAKLLGRVDSSFGDFVKFSAGELVRFIYDHIELARRRALNEMVQAASTARGGEDLRRRIIDYLEQTEWDERLEEIRSSTRGGLDCLKPILDELLSPHDAVALRAASGRSLASYPDVPGFLIVRGLAEALCGDVNKEVVQQNIRAAIAFSFKKFGLQTKEVAEALGQIFNHASQKAEASPIILETVLSSENCDRSLVRYILQDCPNQLNSYTARWLITNLLHDVSKLTR